MQATAFWMRAPAWLSQTFKRVKDSLLIQVGEVPLVEIGGYYGPGSEGGSDLCGSPRAHFDLGGDCIVTPDSPIPLLSCRFFGPVAQAD